jgi:biopolymer transport protein TolQ
MDAQSALTPESFSIFATFLRADWVVKLVLVGLLLASLWSWTVIIDKLVRFTALNREADAFEREVASGRPLEDIAAEAGTDPRHALPRMLQAALRDWREDKGKGGDTATALLLQRIDRALDSIIARESARVEDGLGSLAIVATSSPFIGLFGTVWGIMHAFQAIAVEKNTNLFATAVGLAAAIPAYIAYNKFSTDAGKFTSRLEGFADELSAAVSRRLAERIKG